jgi:hypothetical protein
MPSVVGLLEERELAARVRTEALRDEADRVLAALADSESDWQEWVIARQRVGVVLRDGPVTPVQPEPVAGAVDAAPAVAVDAFPLPQPQPVAVPQPVAAGVVPVSAGPGRMVAARSGGNPVTRSCPEIAVALGMEVTKNNIEGRVRHVAKRLVERGWLVEPVQGRFRLADGPAAAS